MLAARLDVIRAKIQRRGVRSALASMFYAVILGGIYWPVLIGVKTLKTVGPWPSGPLFVVDPSAGGPLSMPLEQAVSWGWQHLQLPLWIPWQAFGLDLAGNQGNAWFLPEILFHTLFPGNFSLWGVVRLFVLAVGTFLLAEDLQLGFLGSVVAGLLMALTGPSPANINLGMLNPLAILPFALLSVRRVILPGPRSHKVIWMTVFALLIDLSFLAGFPEVLPLTFLLIALCTCAWVLGSNRSLREKAIALLSIGGAAVAGSLGALIATVPLLNVLGSYFTYQSPGSYLGHVPAAWTLTLINPSFFGPSMTAGPLDFGQSVWSLGNPLLWGLVIVGAGTAMQESVRKRVTVGLFACLVLFGMVGYSDQFNVLKIFAVPPFDLVLMVRFLPFLWWLPACLLAGLGVKHLSAVSSSWRPVPWLVVLAMLIGGLRYVSVHPTEYFGVIPPPVSIFSYSVPAILFLILAVLVALFAGRYIAFVMVALLVLTVYVNVPTNFFNPVHLGKTVSLLQKYDSGSSDFHFFLNNGTLEAAANGAGVTTVQSWSVYYPYPYVRTLESLFPRPAPESPAGVIFAAAPTMSELPWSAHLSSALRFLGVDQIVSPTEVPLVYVNQSALASGLLRNGELGRRALRALLSVYMARPDLIKAYPPGKGLGEELLRWAIAYGTTVDAASKTLAPFSDEYRTFYQARLTHPDLHFFTVGKGRELSIQANGQTTYVYTLNTAPSVIWTPQRLDRRRVSSYYQDLRRGEFATLDSTAFVPPQTKAIALVPHVTLISQSIGTQYQIFSMRASRTGLVVLRVTPTSSQQVSVDGRRVSWIPVDGGLFMGIKIPKGLSKVTIDYLGGTTLLSLWISVTLSAALMLSLLGLLAAGWFIRASKYGVSSYYDQSREDRTR